MNESTAVRESKQPQTSFYVASRASIPERGQMWQAFREEGYKITSSWIDEDGEGATSDFTELWDRIQSEIATSDYLILYAEQSDFPLKGALIEVGMALAMNKPVMVSLPGVEVAERSCRPIGSWIAHRLVERNDDVRSILDNRALVPAQPASEQAADGSFNEPQPGDVEHMYERTDGVNFSRPRRGLQAGLSETLSPRRETATEPPCAHIPFVPNELAGGPISLGYPRCAKCGAWMGDASEQVAEDARPDTLRERYAGLVRELLALCDALETIIDDSERVQPHEVQDEHAILEGAATLALSQIDKSDEDETEATRLAWNMACVRCAQVIRGAGRTNAHAVHREVQDGEPDLRRLAIKIRDAFLDISDVPSVESIYAILARHERVGSHYPSIGLHAPDELLKVRDGEAALESCPFCGDEMNLQTHSAFHPVNGCWLATAGDFVGPYELDESNYAGWNHRRRPSIDPLSLSADRCCEILREAERDERWRVGLGQEWLCLSENCMKLRHAQIICAWLLGETRQLIDPQTLDAVRCAEILNTNEDTQFDGPFEASADGTYLFNQMETLSLYRARLSAAWLLEHGKENGK